MGRPAKPWYRKSVGAWYATIAGKKVFLVRGEQGPAEAEAWRIFHALAAADPDARPARGRTDLTVFEATNLYLDHSSAVHAQGTYATNKARLKVVSDALGKLKLAELKPTRIERFLADRKRIRPTISPDTLHRYVTALADAVRYCHRAGIYTGPDPTKGVRKPPKGRRERLLEPEEREALTGAASPALRDLMLALLSTGARPHIIAELTAESVNWDAGTAVVRSKLQDYTVYLPGHLLDRLRELAALHPSGPILRTTTGATWTRRSMSRAFQAAGAKASVKGVTPYTCRHTFGTDAVAGGLDVAIVAQLMNHADLQMFAKHYSKLAQKRSVLKQAAESAARSALGSDVPQAPVAPSPPPQTRPALPAESSSTDDAALPPR